MEEKKTIKISITTLFLILIVIAIIVMGIFMLKINKQQEEQIESNKELKEEINKLKADNNVNSNANTETENTNNSSTESSTKKVSFTDNEIKKSLEEYLNLIGYKHGSKLSILIPLNLINEEDMANLEESGEIEINTGVKYDKFKNQILNYISNNCFDNTFNNDDYINKNGTLYIKNEDGSGDSYKVKNVSKNSDNSYKAVIENDAYDEVITDTINFKITSNSNGKCVIDECDIK